MTPRKGALSSMPKQRHLSLVWRLGSSSESPSAQWTGQELYLLDPEGRTLCRLTIGQTRALFLRLKGLYRD